MSVVQAPQNSVAVLQICEVESQSPVRWQLPGLHEPPWQT